MRRVIRAGLVLLALLHPIEVAFEINFLTKNAASLRLIQQQVSTHLRASDAKAAAASFSRLHRVSARSGVVFMALSLFDMAYGWHDRDYWRRLRPLQRRYASPPWVSTLFYCVGLLCGFVAIATSWKAVDQLFTWFQYFEERGSEENMQVCDALADMIAVRLIMVALVFIEAIIVRGT